MSTMTSNTNTTDDEFGYVDYDDTPAVLNLSEMFAPDCTRKRYLELHAVAVRVYDQLPSRRNGAPEFSAEGIACYRRRGNRTYHDVPSGVVYEWDPSCETETLPNGTEIVRHYAEIFSLGYGAMGPRVHTGQRMGPFSTNPERGGQLAQPNEYYGQFAGYMNRVFMPKVEQAWAASPEGRAAITKFDAIMRKQAEEGALLAAKQMAKHRNELAQIEAQITLAKESLDELKTQGLALAEGPDKDALRNVFTQVRDGYRDLCDRAETLKRFINNNTRTPALTGAQA